MDISLNNDTMKSKHEVPHTSNRRSVDTNSEARPLYHRTSDPGPKYNGPKERKRTIIWAWKWEIIAVIVSIAALFTTVGLLARFNGQEQPTWPTVVNLGALISVCSLIIRTTLMVVVAESISQARWRWFNDKQRPLRDLDRFDAASRGLWGSFRLLFLSWKPNLALLGAVITIAALAIDPFSQQALKTYICDSSSETGASVPVAQYVDGTDILPTTMDSVVWLSTPMKGVVANGFSSNVESSAVNPTCPTGNCTFPATNGITHSSMGLCSRCLDITHTVTKSEMVANHWNYSLPNAAIQDVGTVALASWLTVSTEPLLPNMISNGTYQGAINSSILTFTRSSCSWQNSTTARDEKTSSESKQTTSGWNCQHKNVEDLYLSSAIDILAANCTLYPCLRDYNATVRNGILEEHLISTTPAHKLGADYVVTQNPCNIASPQLAPQSEKGCQYGMNSSVFIGIHGFLENTLKGSCKWDQSMYADDSMHAECDMSAWWLDWLYQNGNTSLAGLENSYGNLATAISNRMRTIGKAFNRVDQGVVSGTAHYSTVCTRFDWYWLILPATLIIMSICLLTAMVMESCHDREKSPVWKSSLLPLLFYGVKPDGEEENQPDSAVSATEHTSRAMDLKEMRDRANHIMVTFKNDEKRGSGFVIGQNSGKTAVPKHSHRRNVSSVSSSAPTIPESDFGGGSELWEYPMLGERHRDDSF
ncbi:hypothetical protein F4779DRAFT_606579 [Xylariaceae sp. FL0662B]|nr:hypothetical protein F4779DRAFT_606579 [Xylariaceae sp. FL0662B]